MGETVTKQDENNTNERLSLTSAVFKRLQWTFLVGYLLAAAGDTLQGSYRYALYDSYGLTRSTIQTLYAVSYASSLFVGTITCSLADRFGRRSACLLIGTSYIKYCILINFSLVWVLTLGSLAWGAGNAFFHTGFEAWLIQENRDRFLDIQSLKRILRNSYVGSALVAIGAGLLAQLLVQLGNFAIPFNVAIPFFLIMIIFILRLWPENYGIKATKVSTSFITSIRILRSDPRIVILGMSSALFDAALYLFVMEWTPTLQRAQYTDYTATLPYGLIFSLFMVFDMTGSFIFDPLTRYFRIQSYMIVVFLFAAIGLLIPILVPQSIAAIISGLVLYEFCVGINRPSMGLLRSLYIPNEIRSTMMSYLRVPQIILILIILLSRASLSTVWICSVTFNLLGMICMIVLRSLKLPDESAHVSEAQILLDETSSPSFKIKRPQFRTSSTASLIPQTSEKSEENK